MRREKGEGSWETGAAPLKSAGHFLRLLRTKISGECFGGERRKHGNGERRTMTRELVGLPYSLGVTQYAVWQNLVSPSKKMISKKKKGLREKEEGEKVYLEHVIRRPYIS